MENHPIPQDVTGFQFKLIGEMTVRQFAYLGIGVFFAWLFLTIPLPLVLRLFLSFVCAFSGFAFAFIPIDGRPLDIMILNFLKALTSQDQFVYQKVGGQLLRFSLPPQKAIGKIETPVLSRAQVEAMLYTMAKTSHAQNESDKKEDAFLFSLATLLTTAQAPIAKPTPAAKPQITPAQAVSEPLVEQKPTTPSKAVLKEIKEKEEKVEQELKEAKAKEQAVPNTKDAQLAHEKAELLNQQLLQLQAQKEQLEKELILLKTKLEAQKQQVLVPTQAASAPPPPKPQATQRIRMIPKDMVKTAGVPFMPDTPNLIVGIVKDPRGNVLPNILVEVKDKEGSPVRAFKTNGVGQFASATTLANGIYTLSFEDPKGEQQFETVQIEAKGEIFSPLEVISQDQRELLRQSLFKTN